MRTARNLHIAALRATRGRPASGDRRATGVAPRGDGVRERARRKNKDDATGRFISEDPIGFRGGINRFDYVGNRPANFTDEFGLRSGDKYPTPLDAAAAALAEIAEIYEFSGL